MRCEPFGTRNVQTQHRHPARELSTMTWQPIQDVNIRDTVPLIAPRYLKSEEQISDSAMQTVLVNREIVKVQRVITLEGEAQLKHMIERHYQLTGSERADDILNNWEDEKDKFWQIYPPSEAQTPMVKDVDLNESSLRVSARAPDGEMCFLPVGGRMSPEQTQRCAD